MKRFSLIIIFLGIFLAYFLVSIPFYSGDLKNHLVWAKSILDSGMLGFYDRKFLGFEYPNYPPLTMILFSFSLLIYNLSNVVAHFGKEFFHIIPGRVIIFLESYNTLMAFLKFPAFLGLFLTSFFAVKYLSLKTELKSKDKILVMLAILLNPALFYVTVVWGQIDLLQIGFLLGAVYLLLRGQKYSSYILAAFSLLTKQIIIEIGRAHV